jgi:hypothetical protein
LAEGKSIFVFQEIDERTEEREMREREREDSDRRRRAAQEVVVFPKQQNYEPHPDQI